jgi:hypothetical protein
MDAAEAHKTAIKTAVRDLDDFITPFFNGRATYKYLWPRIYTLGCLVQDYMRITKCSEKQACIDLEINYHTWTHIYKKLWYFKGARVSPDLRTSDLTPHRSDFTPLALMICRSRQ